MRSVCGYGRVGPRQCYDITLSRPSRYDITNPNPSKPELHPGTPSSSQNHNGRAGTAGSSAPRPVSLQSPSSLLCSTVLSIAPFCDDLALGLSHTHVTSPVIPVCVLPTAPYFGRQPYLRYYYVLHFYPKVNTICPI